MKAWLKDHKQELIIGFLSTLIFRDLLLSCLTSILWALGGTYAKWIRRYGIFILVLFLYDWLIWPSFLALAILHLGDGYPDPVSGDKGSWLGRQVEKLVDDKELGGVLTKWIIPILLQIPWLIILFN